MRNLVIDAERLWGELMETAAIGGTPKGGACAEGASCGASWECCRTRRSFRRSSGRSSRCTPAGSARQQWAAGHPPD